MRKRVGLARAIVLEPSIVLYDEPTTMVDPIMSDHLGDLMLRLKKQLKLTSVVVTHDLDLMLTRLQSHTPSASILIANIPDLTLLPYFTSYNQQELLHIIEDYNTTIAQEAQQYHAILT